MSVYDRCIYFLIILFIWLDFALYATGCKNYQDDTDYSVLKIPSSFLDADAVVRQDLCFFEVHDIGSATKRRKSIITIMNPAGLDKTEMTIFHDNIIQLKNLEGRLRDASGKIIRKLNKEDTEDFSAIPGYSLFEDNRVSMAKMYHSQFPFTVEYEYELQYRGLINWTEWYPYSSRYPVESSCLEICIPSNLGFRYYLQHIDAEPEIETNLENKRYVWSFHNLKPHDLESEGPPAFQQMPAIRTAPYQFEIEGIEGDMSDWQSFGKWFYNLYKDGGELPINAKDKIRKITRKLKNNREKVKAIYQYLQNSTRYVSIQLGIGGWKPMPASEVYRTGYGDCKALVNYMIAMLKVTGIESFPLLTRRQHRFTDINTHFPSNQFNHVILYVPSEQDTVWLECTSKTIPFGHLGSDNDDRHALAVDSTGGKLIRIPSSPSKSNVRLRKSEIECKPDGAATCRSTWQLMGAEQDRARYGMINKSHKIQEKWVINNLLTGKDLLTDLNIDDINLDSKILVINTNTESINLTSRTGNRLFFHLKSLVAPVMPAPEKGQRKHPIVLDHTLIKIDSILITLPDVLEMEASPDNISIKEPFAEFTFYSGFTKDDKLLVFQKLEIKKRIIEPVFHTTYQDFIRQIQSLQRKSFVVKIW